MNAAKVHSGSLNSKLSQLKPGEVLLLEFESVDAAITAQRSASARSRWPVEMAGWTLSTYRIVGVSVGIGLIYHIVRIKRVA